MIDELYECESCGCAMYTPRECVDCGARVCDDCRKECECCGYSEDDDRVADGEAIEKIHEIWVADAPHEKAEIDRVVGRLLEAKLPLTAIQFLDEIERTAGLLAPSKEAHCAMCSWVDATL